MAGENKMEKAATFDLQGLLPAAVPFAQMLLSFILGYLFVKKHLSTVDKWLVVWLIYNATTHLLLEGSFVYLTFTETVEKSSCDTLAYLWREYAKADKRWAVFDGVVASIELITATLGTLLAIVLISAILNNKWYRHYVQIVLCTMELYGGYMTFAPEIFTGSKNLDVSNPVYLWLYLVFFNGLWVVVPLYMLWNSWSSMAPAGTTKSASSPKKAPATPGRYNLRSRKDN